MLPRYRRLSRKETPYTNKSRVVSRTAHFLIRYTPGEKEGWAVHISKSHIPLATSRNALRRKIYSAIKKHTTPKNFLGSHIVQLHTKPQEKTFTHIETEIKNLLEKTSHPQVINKK